MSQQRPRILAIDDAPSNLLTLGAVLARDFDLQTATSGVQGIALALESRPDLILLDVMMPGMDGFETCRRIKAEPKLQDIPVVFVTALSELDAEMQGLALGAADYIIKPINVEIARQRIRNLLERERLRKEVEAQRDLLAAEVAERRLGEIELGATKQRLKLAIESSSLSLWDFEIASGRVYLDENWGKIVGAECGAQFTSVAELFAALHPDDRERIAASAMKTLKGVTPSYREEIRIASAAGGWKWIVCRGKVVERSADGWALRAVGTNVDITQRKAAEAALTASEQRYRTLFENAPLGIALTTFGGSIVAANETMARMFAYRREALISIQARNLYADPAVRDTLLQKIRQNQAIHGYEVELRRADGSLFFGSLTVNTLGLERDGILLSMWEDISARKCAQKALEDSEARFRDIVDYSPIGMVITAPDGRVSEANHALCAMLGYARGELEQLTFLELTHPDDRAASDEQFQQLVCGKVARYQIEKRYLRKDGKPLWTQLTASMLHHVGNASAYVLGQIEDITESRLWREQIYHQAYYDPLTDLPNRRLLFDRIDQALAEAQRRNRSVAVLFLDLDRFKEVNDSLGHDVGDQLLKEVAERLKACVRRVDTVSRQGGDEFVIVLTDMEDPQHAAMVAKKIIEALSAPIRIKHNRIKVTTSIGISLYPDNSTEDGRELIKKADEAMYAAKQDGRNCYHYYHHQGAES